MTFETCQSDYDGVGRKRDHFPFLLRSFANYTSRAKDHLADPCHQTRASCLVMQRCIRPWLENFLL